MVIVPALTHRDYSKQKIISAVVVRFKSAAAEHMSKRINREGPMVEENRADESPDKHLRAVSAQLRSIEFQPLSEAIQS